MKQTKPVYATKAKWALVNRGGQKTKKLSYLLDVFNSLHFILNHFQIGSWE